MNGRGVHAREAQGLPEPVPGRGVEADDERRAWAVAALLVPSPAPVNPSASPSPATNWRPGAVSLTDLAEEIARGHGPSASPEGSLDGPRHVSCVETRVSTAELGRVSFTVDRSNSGLSILVEVESDAAARAVELDRQTLLGSLRLAGLTVLSFRVLVRGQPGPALAQASGSSHVRSGSLPASHYFRARRPEADECADGEGLDVVG